MRTLSCRPKALHTQMTETHTQMTEADIQTATSAPVDRQHVSADVAPELFDEPSTDVGTETDVDARC